jgi:excisionase family DNA binding protein
MAGLLMADHPLLTVPQVAERLQVTEEAVRDWLRAGKLRGYRPGGPKVGWRVSVADLEEFLTDAANRPPKEEHA